MKKLDKDFLNKKKRFEHYSKKIEKLKIRKDQKSKMGKSLSKKEIERISRNELKLSNSREMYLDSIKSLSKRSIFTKNKSIDLICPMLSSLCYTIKSLNTGTRDTSSTLGTIYSKFLESEDAKNYSKNLVREIIFADPELHEYKEAIIGRQNKSSFMDFYNQREDLRQAALEEPKAPKKIEDHHIPPNITFPKPSK